MTAKSLRALLEGLIDYAGLFPPAALSMQDAVRNYARYREEEYAWMLGKFVVPAERVGEVPEEFPLSVLGIDEVKAATVADVERIVTTAEGRTVYVEITNPALLEPLARHGLRAKIRTGGITPDTFPAIPNVAEFLRACKAAGVAFKATAGLHHPLRCLKPLTYAPDAPTGTMHGFLNVFMAAALLEHADEILGEEDVYAFSFDDAGAAWRGHRVTTAALGVMRRKFAISFGSCSFEEPISDLQALQLLT
ncbi:MAG TPA: hypothetical protein VEK57_00170 [Thermoanaerobaculia bacterium]|nr:hypothetical protein [Thermoanaerobaculia bacterium]